AIPATKELILARERPSVSVAHLQPPWPNVMAISALQNTHVYAATNAVQYGFSARRRMPNRRSWSRAATAPDIFVRRTTCFPRDTGHFGSPRRGPELQTETAAMYASRPRQEPHILPNRYGRTSMKVLSERRPVSGSGGGT